MKISKVLNNNVVITTDQSQNEIIVMGRGIAFKKKVGDEISSETVDKVYRLENQTILSQLLTYHWNILNYPMRSLSMLGENCHPQSMIPFTSR